MGCNFIAFLKRLLWEYIYHYQVSRIKTIYLFYRNKIKCYYFVCVCVCVCVCVYFSHHQSDGFLEQWSIVFLKFLLGRMVYISYCPLIIQNRIHLE